MTEPNGLSELESSTNSPVKDNSEKQQRKRMRVPTSCSVCRKRKIKCDKVKPICGSCTKSSVSHLCFYEEPSWVSSDELLKHAKTPGKQQEVVNDASLNVQELSPAVQSKIESLNDKIKQLEASIAVTELSRSALPAFNSFNTTQNSVSPQPVSGPPLQPPLQNFNNYYNNQYYPPQQVVAPQHIPSKPHVPVAQPLNEENKYDSDLNKRVEFFNHFPFIIKKRRLECHGPLTLFSVMKRDVYLKILWAHVWKTLEHARIQADAKQECSKDIIDNIDPITSETITHGKSSALHKELKREKVSQKIISLNDSNKSVDQVVLEALPSKKITMILLLRFFKFVYPFLPFVDENTFLYEVNTVCPVTFENAKIEKLNIKNKYDYCIVGLLLIVIKLAHMSISEKEYLEKPDLKLLKDYKPSPKIITAAKLCLDQYKHWRKPFSLRIMQLLLYFRLYFKFCPEDDDGSDGSESQILLGKLFSSAYAIGLHRDPSKLAKMTKTVKGKVHAEHWRRVWHKLLELDTTESIVTGLPLHVPDDRSYDTQLPSDDIYDDDVERFIVKDFKFLESKNELFRQVITTITNMKAPPTVLEIMHLIKKLENFQHYKIGTLKDILGDQTLSAYGIVKKISYIFETTTITLNLNQKLFEYYESIQDLAKSHEFMTYGLKTSLRIINTAMNLAFNEDLYTGKGYSFYFRAHATNAISRAFLTLTGIALRLSQARSLTKSHDASRYNIYDKFLNLIYFNMDNTLQLLTKMSSNHYNFSRVVTVSSILLHCIKKPDFDFDQAGVSVIGDQSGNDNLIHNHLQDLTVDDLPQYNFFMDLLDSELLHLMEISNSNLVTVLQPAVKRFKNTQERGHRVHNSGQFYDPVNGFTKRNSGSTESSVYNLSPSAINQDNIFNLEGEELNKLLGIPSLNDGEPTKRLESDWISSEEYASLFGVFDDYGDSGI